ncbi:MAG: arginase [Gemmatimonadota bacterium]|nr:arginase [Gemmatimonadota bacterium]
MKRREIGIVSVPMDLGAGRRGVDMGPSAIRIAGLQETLESLGHTVREAGRVEVPSQELVGESDPDAKYLPEITDVCERTRDLVAAVLERGQVPLVLGGDHSLSIGSVAGVAAHYRAQGQPIGLIWFDAHADMNTPDSTPSGNIHGMALSVLLGQGAPALTRMAGGAPALRAEHTSIVGARDIDATEAEIVRASGVRVFTMSEIDDRGMGACAEEAIARATSGTAGFHLSFDLDAIDPQIAPGVGTPVRGGITYREAHLMCEKAARTGGILSMDMVELNPVLDSENRSAHLAVGLIASAMGKTIL